MLKKYILFLFLFCKITLFSQCYTAVKSYDSAIIARQTDGTLWARGYNNYGILGQGASLTGINNFIQIGTDTDWTDQFDISVDIVLAIKSNGTLWYWGYQLGTTNIITPTQVGTATNWRKITVAGSHFAALKTDNTLWTWGFNDAGGLGTGNIDGNYLELNPTQVGTLNSWQDVFSGRNGILVGLKTNGTIWSWGDIVGTNSGYPNSNENNAYASPHQIGTDTNWKYVSIGGNGMSLAIKTDGTLWGWGQAGFYCLYGNGISVYTSLTPIQIGTETTWKTVAVASNSVNALKTNGTLWGWGINFAYQLGNGTNTEVQFPTQSGTDTDWIYLANNKTVGYTDAIKQNQSLYHWSGLNNGAATPAYQIPGLLGTACLLSTENFDKNSFSCFPNPFQDSFSIDLSSLNLENASLQIYNTLGQSIYKKKLLNNIETINTSNWSNGIYIVEIKSNFTTYKIKIIKNY